MHFRVLFVETVKFAFRSSLIKKIQYNDQLSVQFKIQFRQLLIKAQIEFQNWGYMVQSKDFIKATTLTISDLIWNHGGKLQPRTRGIAGRNNIQWGVKWMLFNPDIQENGKFCVSAHVEKWRNCLVLKLTAYMCVGGGGSRVAATSKMECLVIIVNSFHHKAPSWML